METISILDEETENLELLDESIETSKDLKLPVKLNTLKKLKETHMTQPQKPD